MKTLLVTLAVNMAGLFVIFLLLRRHINRTLASTELFRQVETEVDAVIAELNRTTERNITLLEGKIHSLEILLGKADHRLTLMTKQLDKKTQPGPIIYARPSRPIVGEEVPKEKDGPALGRTDSLEPQGETLSQREKVLNWHHRGVENAVIASRLGLTRGEVDLIISLGKLAEGR